MKHGILKALVLSLLLTPACRQEASVDAAAGETQPAAKEFLIEAHSIGEVKNLHRCGGTLLAGQPSEADFVLLKEEGIERVLDLRTEGEVAFDEAALVEEAGMEYLRIPFKGAAELTDEQIDEIRAALREADETPLLMHCGSANRVGGVWIAWRVLDVGDLSFDEAVEHAKVIGLRSDELTERVRAYVSARQQGEE